MAGAVLIDVLSNTLIDSFRPPGLPPYPSLGAALFLRGATESGGASAVPGAWATAHVAVVAASLLLLLAQVLPRRPGTSVLVFFSSRRRHTRFDCDWSSDVCSSD